MFQVVVVSYSYSTIVQSEHTIYWKQCSDWSLAEHEHTVRPRQFYYRMPFMSSSDIVMSVFIVLSASKFKILAHLNSVCNLYTCNMKIHKVLKYHPDTFRFHLFTHLDI